MKDFRMTPSQHARNLAYYTRIVNMYPWLAGQAHAATEPRPEYVARSANLDFVRIPFAGCVVWGFEDELTRQRFISDHPGIIFERLMPSTAIAWVTAKSDPILKGVST